MEFELIKDWYQPDEWNQPRNYIRVYKVGMVEFEEIQTRYDDGSCDLYIATRTLTSELGFVLCNTVSIRCVENDKKIIMDFELRLMHDSKISVKDYQSYLDTQLEAYKSATALYNKYVENINKTGYYITDNSDGAYRYYDPKDNYEWHNPLSHVITQEN